MQRRTFLRYAALAGMGSWLEAQVKKKPPSKPPLPKELTLTPQMRLTEVLNHLAPFTPAFMHMSAEDKALAQQYTLPPHLEGQVLRCEPVREALDFLFGAGWEGSRLAPELRERAGSHYWLARTPYVNGLHRPGEPRHWVCNNRMWAWKWEKTEDGQEGPDDGGRVTIFRRLQADGDVVATQPFSLPRLTDEIVLDTVLDWIKQKRGIIVNVVGYPFAPVEAGRDRQGRPITRLEPLRMRTLRQLFGAELEKVHTLGEWLHLLAAGLNAHFQGTGSDWKWSSTLVRDPGGREVVLYTLRDYGRLP